MAVILALLLVAFGTASTIVSKLIGISKSAGLPKEVAGILYGIEMVAEPKEFDHPYVMVMFMFVGMALNLPLSLAGVGTKPKDQKSYNPAIFIAPALCDMIATPCMNIAIMLCTISTFQMLRGSAVVWTALLSYLVLGKKFSSQKLLGIALTVVGLCVTAASSVSEASSAKDPVTGGLFAIAGSFVGSLMFVLEERYISKYSVPPLMVSGWEGVWGILMTTFLLVGLQNTPGEQHGAYENSFDALEQMKNSESLCYLLGGLCLLVTGYNACGVLVSHHLSAAHRIIIDSCRTATVWGLSLWWGWEELLWQKAFGFLILALGTAVYNEVFTFGGKGDKGTAKAKANGAAPTSPPTSPRRGKKID